MKKIFIIFVMGFLVGSNTVVADISLTNQTVTQLSSYGDG